AEKIFCNAFYATDLSRNDISIDAKIKDTGFGLKTFLYKNGNNLEKIAEFNKDRDLYNSLDDKNMIYKISELRNKRIIASSEIAGVNLYKLIYHSVVRDQNKLLINENSISTINIESIGNIKSKGNIISFCDGANNYSFNKSKSTLYQRFEISPIHQIDIKIADDPFSLLEEMYLNFKGNEDKSNKILDYVILPLYSIKDGKKVVHEKSGLNQWNAGGRPRDPNEIYIPVPAIIHRIKPLFFPPKDSSFTLTLPAGRALLVKICQQNSKALMSCPNQSLGNLVLRDILKLPEGHLVTYNDLKNIGIDSVQINKYEDKTFDITFKKIGAYEEFISYR
ncbi:TPA: hypothetical protein QB367_002146, partial [Pasteurella multocida]|nr:hypothetical protein [Pasteurella multocida]